MRAPKNRLRVRALRSRLYKMRFFIDGKTMQTVTGDSRIGKALKAPKPKFQIPEKLQLPNFKTQSPMRSLVWCLRNNYTFVALKLAWGEARGRECIPSDTRPTEQRSPRPISAQPEGRHVFWAEALLLAPYRSTAGYARRSRLASAQNPLPRMYSYFGDTTLGARQCPIGSWILDVRCSMFFSWSVLAPPAWVMPLLTPVLRLHF